METQSDTETAEAKKLAGFSTYKRKPEQKFNQIVAILEAKIRQTGTHVERQLPKTPRKKDSITLLKEDIEDLNGIIKECTKQAYTLSPKQQEAVQTLTAFANKQLSPSPIAPPDETTNPPELIASTAARTVTALTEKNLEKIPATPTTEEDQTSFWKNPITWLIKKIETTTNQITATPNLAPPPLPKATMEKIKKAESQKTTPTKTLRERIRDKISIAIGSIEGFLAKPTLTPRKYVLGAVLLALGAGAATISTGKSHNKFISPTPSITYKAGTPDDSNNDEDKNIQAPSTRLATTTTKSPTTPPPLPTNPVEKPAPTPPPLPTNPVEKPATTPPPLPTKPAENAPTLPPHETSAHSQKKAPKHTHRHELPLPPQEITSPTLQRMWMEAEVNTNNKRVAEEEERHERSDIEPTPPTANCDDTIQLNDDDIEEINLNDIKDVTEFAEVIPS